MKHVITLLAALLLAPLAALHAADTSAQKRNVFFMLADDLGGSDTALFGTTQYYGGDGVSVAGRWSDERSLQIMNPNLKSGSARLSCLPH